MTKRQTPPGLNSKVLVVVVKPSGPHHCARCFGSLNAANTSTRGASNTRVPMIERGSLPRSTPLLPLTFLLLGLQRFQIIAEAIETFLPESAVLLEPIVHRLERGGFEPARPPLRLARTRDQPGVFEHLEMFGNRGSAHL